MTIRIDGTNTAANPGITGTDTDTGLQFGTDEVNIVTGGSTRATVDSTGRVLVGTTSNFVRGDLQVVAGGGGEITIARNDDSVVAGNDIGHFYFATNDSGTGVTCAQIECYAEHDHTASSASTNLRFNTTAQGATTSTERMRLTSTGDLRFNSGFGSVTTVYGVRAWARVDGDGTFSVYGSGGFDVITDQGTGLYRFNFENSMPDTNYSVSGSTDANTIFQVTNITATNWVQTNIQTTSASATDSDNTSIMVVR